MKVILMRDVEHVGDVGDIVDVADGYGRNFLIPRGFAVAATARNKRQLEHEQLLREHRILRARKDAQTLAEQLQGVPCHFVRKAGEEGKLFGSVTSMDIAEALKAAGFELTAAVSNSTSRSRASVTLQCPCVCQQRPRRC
jgi:large subunit ribosomal protein L9